MKYSDQPSPYAGSALTGVGIVALVRVALATLPSDTAIALLVPLGAIALAFAIVRWLRRKLDWQVQACAAILFGMALWEVFQVYLAGEPRFADMPAVLGSVAVGLWLAARPNRWALLGAMVVSGMAIALDLAQIHAGEGLLIPGSHVAIFAACLGLALAVLSRQRAEAALAALEDEVFS